MWSVTNRQLTIVKLSQYSIGCYISAIFETTTEKWLNRWSRVDGILESIKKKKKNRQ